MARILIVEDNLDTQIVYRTILEHFGHTVTVVGDGETALRMVHEISPDLVTVDISLPLLDGWELARLLKADPQTASIPLLAITAHSLATDRAKSVEVGMDGYLAKPVEPRRIVAEVEHLLTGKRELPARPNSTTPSPVSHNETVRITFALAPSVSNGLVIAAVRSALEDCARVIEIDLRERDSLPDADSAIRLLSAIKKRCKKGHCELRVYARPNVCELLRASSDLATLVLIGDDTIATQD